MQTKIKATWPTVKRPEPRPYLYPGAYGGVVAPCWTCFRVDRVGMAATIDPRIGGGDLVEACGACARAIRSGGEVTLPAGDELRALAVDWARWATNGEVDDDFTARMLAACFPHLADGIRACWWECLQGALLEVQEASGPGVDWAAIAPEDRDADALLGDAEEKAIECLDALMSGARTVQTGGAR